MASKTFIFLIIFIVDALFIVEHVGGTDGYYKMSGQLICKRNTKAAANLKLEFYESGEDNLNGKATTNGTGYFHFNGYAYDRGSLLHPFIKVIFNCKNICSLCYQSYTSR